MKISEITGNFIGIVKTEDGHKPLAVKVDKGKIISVIVTEEANVKPIAVETAKTFFVKLVMWEQEIER
jgi:hypothetical protein